MNAHFSWIAPWLVLAWLMAGCSQKTSDGLGQTNAAREPGVPGPPMTFESSPITTVNEILTVPDPKALWTRAAQLSGLRVQRILNPQVILAGPDPDHLLVIKNEAQTTLQTNQVVDIAGVIANLGEDLSQWNLKPEDQKLVRSVAGANALMIVARKIETRGGPQKTTQ